MNTLFHIDKMECEKWLINDTFSQWARHFWHLFACYCLHVSNLYHKSHISHAKPDHTDLAPSRGSATALIAT